VDKEDGPLSVRVQDFEVLRAALDVWEGVEEGEGPAVRFDRDAIVIGSGISVGWKHAGVWQGVFAREVGEAGDRKGAIELLDALLLRNTPVFEYRGIMSSLSESLDDVVRALGNRNDEQVGEMLRGMLGLGEGLTPMGDDLAMGVLAGMVWLAEAGKLDRGWVVGEVENVRGVAGEATNRISERLLWYAGEGVLYAPAMELGVALLAGDVNKVDDAARRLLAIGHSTGYGVGIGMRCVVGSR
jgi:hypothetical protein